MNTTLGAGRPAWSTRASFLLATIGAAVGLGNFWKFPYLAGENGGGAFVLIYVLSILVIIVPLVIAEIMIGRMGRSSAIGSTLHVARAQGRSPVWSVIGWIGTIGAFLILTYYSVIGGWVASYVVEAARGAFVGATADGVDASFGALLADPARLILFHGLFMVLSVLIVVPGLNKGIEPAINLLMPVLFVMLVGLAIYAGIEGDFAEGSRFLFTPDFSKITPDVMLAAIGQGFFSVGVALAVLITYGAYLSEDVSIPRSALIIAFSDTAVALTAAMLIFPIVFAHGLNPGQGPTLIFVTLPLAFGDMAGGQIIACAFFILLFVAAITSSIALLEILVSTGEAHFGWARRYTGLGAGLAAFVLGFGTVFSFNIWADFHPLGFLSGFETSTVFDVLDYLTSNIMLPVTGLLIALFVGWRVTEAASRAELRFERAAWFQAWRFALRYLAPIAIVGVLLANVL